MSISSTVVDGADIRFHAAAPALQPYVGCFWVITAGNAATVRVVPDGTTSIAIALQQNCSVDAYLRGPLLRPVELQFTAPTTLIGVRLRPGVAFNLSGVAAHSMVDRRAPLSDYCALRELGSIDPVPDTPAEWVATLQSFLIGRLEGTSIHPLVASALAEIHAAHGCVSVSDVAVRCRTSERHLSRLMRDWVGYGPKRYAAIVRFQSTLAQMERVPQLPVAILAAETGYFDQSHLTVDVARYAGDTPGRLISEHVSDFSKTRCDVPF
jgi:AraC-like DNA-binding protein